MHLGTMLGPIPPCTARACAVAPTAVPSCRARGGGAASCHRPAPGEVSGGCQPPDPAGGSAALGPVSHVVREYEAFLLAKSESHPAEAPEPATAVGPARLTSARVGSAGGPEIPLYTSGDPLAIEIAWETEEPQRMMHSFLDAARERKRS